MKTYRKTALIVGGPFISGTAAGVASVGRSAPRREAVYLANIAANPDQLVVATLFVLLMGLAYVKAGAAEAAQPARSRRLFALSEKRG